MNPQVLPGQSLAFGVGGLLADGKTAAPLGSCTATIDNYSAGYIGAISPGPQPGVQAWGAVVNRNVPAGTTVTVNITVKSTSQNATSLPDQTFAVDLVGPAAPGQATSCNVQLASPSTQWSGATDPGSATLTLI